MSAIHGRQLLSFACPKESNQRKRHPRIRALAVGEGSLRADGFGPQAIHGLLSESARSLAPPACGARGFSVHPPPLLRGDLKSKAKEGKKKDPDVSHISGVAYIRCFCGRDCRALLYRVPSRPRRAGAGIAARSAGARRMRARDRDREGAFFFGYFLLGKQKKVTGRQDGGRRTQGRESVLATKPEQQTNTIPTQPSSKGEG